MSNALANKVAIVTGALPASAAQLRGSRRRCTRPHRRHRRGKRRAQRNSDCRRGWSGSHAGRQRRRRSGCRRNGGACRSGIWPPRHSRAKCLRRRYQLARQRGRSGPRGLSPEYDPARRRPLFRSALRRPAMCDSGPPPGFQAPAWTGQGFSSGQAPPTETGRIVNISSVHGICRLPACSPTKRAKPP